MQFLCDEHQFFTYTIASQLIENVIIVSYYSSIRKQSNWQYIDDSVDVNYLFNNFDYVHVVI